MSDAAFIYNHNAPGDNKRVEFPTLEAALLKGYNDSLKPSLGVPVFFDQNNKVICGYNTLVAITRQFITRQNPEVTVEQVIAKYVRDHWPDLASAPEDEER